MHVVESPFVSWSFADNKRRRSRPPATDLVLVKFFPEDVTAIVVRGGSRTTGVFPFSLSGKSIIKPLLVAKPLTVCLCVVPVYINYRFVVFFGKTVGCTTQFLMLRIKKLVLIVGHFQCSDVKRLCNSDTVDRFLIEITFTKRIHPTAAPCTNYPQHLVRQGSFDLAHFKSSRLDPDKFHPSRVNIDIASRALFCRRCCCACSRSKQGQQANHTYQ